MSASRLFAVPPEAAGSRLDRFLADQIADWSRTALERQISAGNVTVDGRIAAPSLRLKGGESILALLPDPEPTLLEAEDLPLCVVHEDEQFLVLDKPAGLVVHPGAGVRRGTLVNALVHRFGKALEGVGGAGRPGIVHRLDKGTSGLLVVARTQAAYLELTRQFAAREIEKEYLALVIGLPPRTGRIDAPIGRSPAARTRMAARQGGRPALTTWTVLEEFCGALAWLSIGLHTGRTHQIRVHMASAGHPLVGDSTYGAGGIARIRPPELRALLNALPRPALHATRLTFLHPETRQRVEFRAAPPEDLSELLARLRIFAAN